MPVLSVVIANYNYGRFLEEAVQSVLTQSCQDFELIVVDGGSTDNSVEVIKKHQQKIAWWCSEKDRGQSHAFNKGFAHAQGRFLTWLNADDVMLPGTIAKLKLATERHPRCEWFVGGVFWLDPEMRIVNCGRGRPFSEIRYLCGDVNGYGPSTFFSRRLLSAVGGVDERFHLMMDTDLWFRFAQAGARYKPFCNYAWGLRLHPGAKMSDHNFDSEGKLVIGGEANENHRQQLDRERALMLDGVRVGRLTLVKRLLSASWFRVFAARIDLLRFKGRNYQEYFK